MIRDLRTEQPGPNDHADVCVIGAGAAGICLALELTRLGQQVTLIEAGGPDVEEGLQEPYRSEVVGHEHRGVHTGRFRALGGTTQRWGGQILELDQEDFAPREWVKGSGWPIPKEELVPYYQRALQIEGVDGALAEDREVWRTLGLSAPEFPQLELYFTRWCPEPSFARLHGKALKESVGLSVWLHATAVEMMLDGEAVCGLRVRASVAGDRPREAVVRARFFVFCLGTIECVRFFLQPREGGLPWNRSGLLGRHFQDHIDVDVATILPRSRRSFGEVFDNVFFRGYKYHPKLRLSPAVQQESQSLNCAATVTFGSPSDEALNGLKTTAKHLLRGRWTEVGWRDGLRAAQQAPLLARQSWRFTRQHRVYNPPDAKVRLRVHCEQEPAGESSIGLGEERDAFGLLRTRLDWRLGKRELATVRTLAQVAADSLHSLAQVDILPEVDDDGLLAAACDDSNHHMGGMRMAASEAEGVVSTDLRVFGTHNAFVCSGAVFPSSGFSNPTHTVIALAMRLARHLADGGSPAISAHANTAQSSSNFAGGGAQACSQQVL